LKTGFITSTPILIRDQTSEVASVYSYVLDWVEGKTNIPNSRGDVPLTSPHPLSLDSAEGGQ